MSMSPDNADELRELLDLMREGRLSRDQGDRLDGFVIENEGACRAVVEYLDVCATLEWEYAPVDWQSKVFGQDGPQADGPSTKTPPGAAPQGPAAAPAALPPPAAPAPLPPPDVSEGIHPPKTTPFSMFLPNERWLDVMPVVMFAVLMLSVGVFLGWRVGNRQNVQPAAPPAPQTQAPDRSMATEMRANPTPVPSALHAATLVDARDCLWIESPAEFHPGAAIQEGGSLRLAVGVAEIMFRSGVRLTLEGPAVLSSITAGGGVLEAGNLAAVVPPDAVGFAVRTPAATLIDLGTAFGVSVDQARVTELHVIEGRVAIQANAAAHRQIIEAPRAWRLPSQDRHTWVQIDVVPERFYRTATTHYSPLAAEANVAPAAMGPDAQGADTSATLPAIDGLDTWTVLANDAFDAARLDGERWEILGGPAVQENRKPAVALKGGSVELINCGVLLSKASFASTGDRPLRVTAQWHVAGAMDKPSIAVDASPADNATPGFWLTRGIQCSFGAINPQTREPALVILFGYPGQQQMEASFAPCPAPEAGGRYRLDVVRHAERVTFHVTRLDGDGWSRVVTGNVPAGFSAQGERRVALSNFDLESTGDVVSRVNEVTISTSETNGGK